MDNSIGNIGIEILRQRWQDCLEMKGDQWNNCIINSNTAGHLEISQLKKRWQKCLEIKKGGQCNYSIGRISNI